MWMRSSIKFSVQHSPCSIKTASKHTHNLVVGIWGGRDGLQIGTDATQAAEERLQHLGIIVIDATNSRSAGRGTHGRYKGRGEGGWCRGACGCGGRAAIEIPRETVDCGGTVAVPGPARCLGAIALDLDFLDWAGLVTGVRIRVRTGMAVGMAVS